MHEYGTLKLVKVTLRMGKGKRDEPNPGRMYTYMKMSRKPPA
jgi:hypothetical protein